MSTSIWKKLADVAGFTNVSNLFGAIGRGDWSRAGYEWVNMPYEYIQNIKNWDNDSSESNANSATSVDNSVVSGNNQGVLGNSNYGNISSLVNKDGSINFGNITSLEELGPIALEALTGALPELTRQWNSAEAQKERDWQTEMSNSAYQRSVADMKTAGINPILAYSQGGATSGVGASGSATPSSASGIGSMMEGLNSIVKTVLDKDMKSDEMTHKAAMDALKFTDSHSATVASNKYYKTLNKLNELKLREASAPRNKLGF